MGLLTTAQSTAIAAGARMRQVWKIHVPRASGSTTFDAVTIHDDDSTTRRVTDPGSREVFGYNISFREEGKLEAGSYDIVVDNAGAYFCPEMTGNVFYNSTGSYQATPTECDLEHEVYVWDAAASPAAWSELTMANYRGQILTVEYEDLADPDGAIADMATISTQSRAVQSALDYRWTVDDGDDDDTGFNITGP